jgi:D-alanyl-D-alanine carboxypeptidase/D-alanyl-D-alanine-endopeptidase (penicillin-binding protein 4)
MNHISSRIFPIFVFVFFSWSSLQSGERPGSATPRATATGRTIDSLVRALSADSLLAPASVGIEIAVASSGSVLYALQAKKVFPPASTAKILTTGTALHLLGSRYRFITPFSTNGTVANGSITGDLIVHGSGDPILNVDDFDSACSALAATGIRRITGNLTGNVTLFDSVTWGKGWMWDDEPNSDEAYITPLTIEKNSITISVTPSDQVGKPPKISLQPQSSDVRILNEATTIGDESGTPVEVFRPHNENSFTVRGRISRGDGVKEFAVSVVRPDLFFLQLLRERLASHGIIVGGAIAIDTISGKRTLYRVVHTLDTVVAHINKWSYNLGAENLLRVTAAERRHAPGTADTGIGLIMEQLFTSGADTSSIILADGSGISRYSLISPDAMVKFLLARYRGKKSFPSFLGSLPVAGVDGTLMHRMKGTAASGNARAKTGTMTGISTLAGYVNTKDGTLLAYAIFVNNIPRSTSPARILQDAVISHLAGLRLK